MAAVHQAADDVIREQLAIIAIPKRFLIPMKQIWELQWWLPQRNAKYAERTLNHEKFRAGYDFLLMREASGEHLHGLGQWWTRYQEIDSDQRQAMLDDWQQQKQQYLGESEAKPTKGRHKKKNYRKRKTSTASPAQDN